MNKLSFLKIPGVPPVFAMFFLEAAILGNWIPRIPDVKVLFDLSATWLGIYLFVLAFGTLLAFIVGGALVRNLGLRMACQISLPAWSLAVCAVPFIPNEAMLFPLMLSAGLAIGLVEVAMNTAAHRLEQDSGRRLMSRAHGFWSLGSLFGAVMGAGLASLGLSLQMHFLLAMPTIGFVSWLFARKIPYQRTPFDGDEATSSPSVFKLPNRGLILLCVMPIGIMLVEGAFIDWSALFIRTVLSGGPEAAGLIYAAFSLVMAAARLSGDWLVDTYGPVKVAKFSSVAATIGIVMFSLAPNVTFAFIGALFSGLGVAVFYPLTMSAAATRPGNSEDNVAAMSLFAFTSFMIAPPALGILIDHAGMRTALIVLAPLAAYSYFLSHELTKGQTANE